MERQITTTIIHPFSTSINPSTSELTGQYLNRKYTPFIFLVDAQMDVYYTNVSKEKPFFGSELVPSNLKEITDSDSLPLIQKEIERTLNESDIRELRDISLSGKTQKTSIDLRFEPFKVVEHPEYGHLVELSIQASHTQGMTEALTKKMIELRDDNSKLHDQVECLGKTNEYLDRFVSGAAHDLRGPLVVLKSYVDLIRRFDQEEKKLEALDHMKNATIRFENVVNGLVESVEFKKRGKCNAERISFYKVYEMVLFQLSTDLELIRPAIEVDFSKVSHIFFIKSYLNSILYNLLSNALKYRCEERPLKLKLSSSEEGGFIVLSIEDNGIGIDLGRCAAQLFQPFQRLTTQAEGIGIGLSLINRMAEENGGSISVESTLGESCCFKVFLKPYDKR